MSLFNHPQLDDYLFSFLDIQSIRQLSQVNSHYHRMIAQSIYGHALTKYNQRKGNVEEVYIVMGLEGHVALLQWIDQTSSLTSPSEFLMISVRGYLIYPELATLHDIVWIMVSWIVSEEKHFRILTYLEPFIYKKILHWDEIFLGLCRGVNLTATQYFYSQYSSQIDLYYKNNSPLRDALVEGHLGTAEWLYHLDREKKYSLNSFEIEMLCYRGRLNCLKWVVSVFSINIASLSRNIFLDPAVIQNQPMVEFLISQGADYHVHQELIFRTACRNGNLEFARYLVNLNHTVDYHANDDHAFREAYLNHHYEVCKYLLTLDYRGKISRRKFWKEILHLKIYAM